MRVLKPGTRHTIVADARSSYRCVSLTLIDWDRIRLVVEMHAAHQMAASCATMNAVVATTCRDLAVYMNLHRYIPTESVPRTTAANPRLRTLPVSRLTRLSAWYPWV